MHGFRLTDPLPGRTETSVAVHHGQGSVLYSGERSSLAPPPYIVSVYLGFLRAERIPVVLAFIAVVLAFCTAVGPRGQFVRGQ